jgi:hypothetical protein
MIGSKRFTRQLRGIGVLAAALFGAALTPATSAQAQDVYTFKSVLSTPSESWCITVPAGDPNTHLVVTSCDGQPHQAFAYDNGSILTNGGYCMGGLSAVPNQPPSAGNPAAMTDCSGGDDQAWQLPPFKDQPDVFAIANPDGLCVTIETTPVQPGGALVLAQCAEQPPQGWVRSKVAAIEGQDEFYWYGGHRYCWYDAGWHGGGWYWCGENFHRGIGWGGPIGWHWWHHRGHPWRPRPFPHPGPHGHGPVTRGHVTVHGTAGHTTTVHGRPAPHPHH